MKYAEQKYAQPNRNMQNTTSEESIQNTTTNISSRVKMNCLQMCCELIEVCQHLSSVCVVSSEPVGHNSFITPILFARVLFSRLRVKT